MLCKINGDVIQGNVYEIKDKLKALKCVWKSDAKHWEITKQTDLVGVGQALEDLNNQHKDKITNAWREACALNNIKFCKKNDEDYDKVYKSFRELLSR